MILLVFLLETNDFLYSSVLLVFIIFFSDICCDWHTLRVVGIIRLLLVAGGNEARPQYLQSQSCWVSTGFVGSPPAEITAAGHLEIIVHIRSV